MCRVESPVVVISPHCDDGVLSCGDLLERRPGGTVVTVFAGGPGPTQAVTEWDRAAGFGPGDDVMAIRRQEDASALALLHARPVWLDFWDSQYGATPARDTVAGALADTLGDIPAAAVFVPLGLFHSDHRLVHEAALRIRSSVTQPDWFLYADALYRSIPGLLSEGLVRCEAAGLRLDPVGVRPHVGHGASLKAAAVGCYRSQLRALATPGRLGHQDAFAPEQYWRVHSV